MENPLFVVITDNFIVPIQEVFIFRKISGDSQLNVRSMNDGIFNVYTGSYENCKKLLLSISLTKSIIYMREDNIKLALEK